MKYLVATFALSLLAAGCTQEELFTTDTDVAEGEPTTLILSLKEPKMNAITRVEASNETEIRSIAIYIINNETKQVISSTLHAKAAIHIGNIDDGLDPGQIKVETITGGNRSIYVIANYDAANIENLRSVATQKDVESLVAEYTGNPTMREFGLTMVAYIDSTPIKKGVPIDVNLGYIGAKVTTNVINNSNGKFEVLGWGMGNIPIRTYVFEHHNTTGSNYDVLTNNDYYNDFADQVLPFESGIGTTADPHSNIIYLYENYRGMRDTTKPDIPIGYPYGGTGIRQPYQEKAWYAPINATYLVVHGLWKDTDDSGITTRRQVTINHYLGANNTNDYNIARGYHYIYNITINSLSNIWVDTNVEMKENNLFVTPPADAMSMDSHYGFRPITLDISSVTEPGSKISIEVLEAVNSNVPCPWLNLSMVTTFIHSVRDQDFDYHIDNRLKINTWLQDGDPWMYVRPKFVPNMEDRKTGGIASQYTPPLGMTIDFNNNDNTKLLPDNDVSMPFHPNNFHRMVKKFTNLPTNAPDDPYAGLFPNGFSITLYAKEYEYIDYDLAPSFREGVVRVTLERPNHTPEYTHFTIRQYAPQVFAKMGNDILIVERIEEYEHLLLPTMPMDMQMLAGMQWGPFDLPATKPSYGTSNTTAIDGWTNTLLGVYKTANNTQTSNQSTNFLTMYGSRGGGWDKGSEGIIKQGDISNFPNGHLIGYPYFSLPKTNDRNSVHTIYNMTAARYCHEKNWDANGDGVIAEDEVKWYLPSTVEVQLLWAYHEVFNLKPELYWSSNQANSTEAIAHSMMPAQKEPHRVYNGVQQAYPKTRIDGENPPRVRCVRRIPATKVTQTPTIRPIVYHTALASIVDCSNLPGAMTTTTSKLGIPTSSIAAVQQANERVYRKFEVQRSQNPAVGYTELYRGAGRCRQDQGWRLPTQREMLIIHSVLSDLEANSNFTPFQKTDANNTGNGKYWTMSADLSNQYIIDFADHGLCRTDQWADKANVQFRYRCIRELN